MIGAIIGDVIGSIYEFRNTNDYNFDLFTSKSTFTDDTVLTIATIDSLLNNIDFTTSYKEWALKYIGRGYGGHFTNWILSNSTEPYNSCGNGSAMRVSPVGWYYNNLVDILDKARQSAEVTHNHPDGILGAQITAGCIYLARNNYSKEEIKQWVLKHSNYNVDAKLKPITEFNGLCSNTVPPAIIAFLESKDFESAIRLTISVGGDSDTMGAITGAIAEAYYKDIPEYIIKETYDRLPEEMINLLDKFNNKICHK